jgi:NADPH2:quinone reductase
VQALAFSKFGGPEVLRSTELPDPELLAKTALVRMKAIGVNFADVYRRQGRYHLEGNAPWILGYEGAGVIEAIAADDGGRAKTSDDARNPAFRVGDRVAFADVPRANAEIVRAPLSHLVPLPQHVSFETAAALLLQGLTAQYLVEDSHSLRRGELAVVLAAAGGVGALLLQLVKNAGCRVLAVTSTSKKAEIARAAGADETCLASEDWPERAHALSNGRGADVVFDSVGATLDASLRAARTGGHVVFYGMAGGDPAPVDPRRLMDESKTLTGGDLWNVLSSSEERVRRANALFELVSTGGLSIGEPRVFPLAEGAKAHALLEGRATTGKLLLLP